MCRVRFLPTHDAVKSTSNKDAPAYATPMPKKFSPFCAHSAQWDETLRVAAACANVNRLQRGICRNPFNGLHCATKNQYFGIRIPWISPSAISLYIVLYIRLSLLWHFGSNEMKPKWETTRKLENSKERLQWRNSREHHRTSGVLGALCTINSTLLSVNSCAQCTTSLHSLSSTRCRGQRTMFVFINTMRMLMAKSRTKIHIFPVRTHASWADELQFVQRNFSVPVSVQYASRGNSITIFNGTNTFHSITFNSSLNRNNNGDTTMRFCHRIVWLWLVVSHVIASDSAWYWLNNRRRRRRQRWRWRRRRIPYCHCVFLIRFNFASAMKLWIACGLWMCVKYGKEMEWTMKRNFNYHTAVCHLLQPNRMSVWMAATRNLCTIRIDVAATKWNRRPYRLIGS